MDEFIAGIERELGSSTSARTRFALNAFRARLRGGKIAGGRKLFEQELERFIGDSSSVRAAAERHLNIVTTGAIEQANTALKRAEKLLARSKARLRTV
jgi:hypothetical protein